VATLFHLIRHAAYPLLEQALGGREPHALSAEGRAQAERLAASLGARPIAAVICSPVRRAMETGEPIARICGLQVESDPAFAEIDYAAWSGRPFAGLSSDPAWQAWNRFRSVAGVPGGETMLAVQARAVAGLVRLAARHPAAELVVVSHADVIKSVLGHFLGSPPDLMHRLELAPASVSRVRLFEQDVQVLDVNLTLDAGEHA
jgi:broad specificity phosphatase PhoE